MLHYFSHCSRDDMQVTVNDYTAFKSDEKWWVGLIVEVDSTQLNAQASITYIFWPSVDDMCWVPFQQILCKVAAISPSSTFTGSSYSISAEHFNAITNAYANGR